MKKKIMVFFMVFFMVLGLTAPGISYKGGGHHNGYQGDGTDYNSPRFPGYALADENGDGYCDGTGIPFVDNDIDGIHDGFLGNKIGFVDEDGDGYCDKSGIPFIDTDDDGLNDIRGNGYGYGKGYVDVDGDGICDGTGINFVDEDGDGICDNIGSGYGKGYVDEDGDGICDNTGINFVDEDGDGICDHTGITRGIINSFYRYRKHHQINLN